MICTHRPCHASCRAGLTSIYPETCPIVGASTANASSCVRSPPVPVLALLADQTRACAAQYLQNVINNGNQTALSEAYFAMNSIKVYNANGTLVSASGASSSVSPTSTAAQGSKTTSGAGAGSRGALSVFAAGVGALAAWTLL